MDPDETTLTQISKRSRIANGKVKRRGRRAGAGEEEEEDDEEEEEEEEEEEKVARAWQQASRIYRVSRASGGKDRHSKVITAKGLRDRRVRLSVSTAIQFYDLQDRLGYDQPSKAVEWLIKAAQDAIAELPSLNGTFPNRTRPTTTLHQQHSSTQNDSFYESSRDEALVVVRRGGSEARAEADPEPDPSAHRYLTKSTCSSTSETSKGSVLSLTRSESRVKARERARERAKEKEKVVVSTTTSVSMDQHALNTNSHSGGSFTELLMDVNLTQQTPGYSHKGGGGKREETSGGSLAFASHAMDYLNAGVYGPGLFQASKTHNHNSNQPHFSSPLMSIASLNHPSFMGGVDHHPELQQFSFSQDHLIPVTNDYNLNFSMTSLGAGYNRGTLQSNSSPLPHIQKFSSPADGGAIMPFFLPTAHANTAENQFSGGLDGRLQLCYSDGCRHSDLKGKGRN